VWIPKSYGTTRGLIMCSSLFFAMAHIYDTFTMWLSILMPIKLIAIGKVINQVDTLNLILVRSDTDVQKILTNLCQPL
jgi:hypothetical protein